MRRPLGKVTQQWQRSSTLESACEPQTPTAARSQTITNVTNRPPAAAGGRLAWSGPFYAGSWVPTGTRGQDSNLRPLGYEPTSRHLPQRMPSQTRRSRSIPVLAIAPRLTRSRQLRRVPFTRFCDSRRSSTRSSSQRRICALAARLITSRRANIRSPCAATVLGHLRRSSDCRPASPPYASVSMCCYSCNMRL